MFDEDRGLVRQGKRADLLIADTDPLTDIAALFNPSVVIKNGKIFTW